MQHAAYFPFGGYIELLRPGHDIRNMPTVKVVTVAHNHGKEHDNGVDNSHFSSLRNKSFNTYAPL
jgi:hypothetical protein